MPRRLNSFLANVGALQDAQLFRQFRLSAAAPGRACRLTDALDVNALGLDQHQGGPGQQGRA
ncbi:hypothetical protein ACFQU7_26975 [Pseudoroseomonas wenyumeiae]